ncbi:MAG: disease resistance protein, partial [Candidatus Electrothrix sp. AS4_5]|nr:disease resistance protein [Candidatus Electrothrix gigas]
HAIMLWQYYGTTKKEGGLDGLIENLKNSDMQWGLQGIDLTRFAVIEGDKCNLFVRMAKRAANIFSSKEREAIRFGAVKEIMALVPYR